MFRINKLVSLLLVIVMMVPMSLPAGAVEKKHDPLGGLIQYVDDTMLISENRFIANEELIHAYLKKNINEIRLAMNYTDTVTIEQVEAQILTLINNANTRLESGDCIVIDDGQLIDISAGRNTRSQSSEYFWWGVRHTFYTDGSARGYAYQVRTAAHTNVAAGILAGALFGGAAGIPNGLTALWAYSVADAVDYNANLDGNGVELDLNYLIFYSCRPL